MVSYFIDEYNGSRHLTANEFAQACQSHTDFPSSTKARCIVKYGANREGYWNSDKFICQVEVALRILNILQRTTMLYGCLTKVVGTVHTLMMH